MTVRLFFVAVGALALACGSPTRVLPPADVAGGAQAVASPSPSPAPSPSPLATPAPPEPSPEINDNDRPVDRVGAGVYYVICNDEIVPNSRNARQAPVGCRVHLDATPKDEDGVPTNPRYPVRWVYSQPQLLDVTVRSPLGPILMASVPHRQDIYVIVDGVDSNTFSITFVAP